MTANDVFSILNFGINNDEEGIPKGRSFVGAVSLTSGQPIRLDLKPLVNLQRMADIKSIFIDNSVGVGAVSVSMVAMGTVVIPTGYQAIIPIFMSGDNVLTFSGNGAVNFAMVNVDVHLGVWNTAGGGGSANLGNNVDAVAPVTSGLVGNDVYLYAYDNLNGVWSRARLNPNDPSVTRLAHANASDSIIVTAILSASDVQGAGGDIVTLQAGAGTDAENNNTEGLYINSRGDTFNGVSWDRQRGNVDTAALVTLAATAAGSVVSADQTNYNGRGVQLSCNITALGAATNVTFGIQGKDPVSGVYYPMLATTAIALTGFNRLTVYPGVTVAANAAQDDVLPRTWRCFATVAGTNTATATVGASVIL